MPATWSASVPAGTGGEGHAVPKRQKPRLIVQRVFTGEKSMEDVLFPVIYEDLRRQLERRRTLDKGGESG